MCGTHLIIRERRWLEWKYAGWVINCNKYCKTQVVSKNFQSFTVGKYSSTSNSVFKEYDCYCKFCKLQVWAQCSMTFNISTLVCRKILLLLLFRCAAYHYTTAKTTERAWRKTCTSTCVTWIMLTVRVSGLQCYLCTLSNKYLWLAVFQRMVAVMVWSQPSQHVVLESITTFPHVWFI